MNENERSRHPLMRRINWNPFVVAPILGFMIYRICMGRTGIIDYTGAAFIGLWFALAAVDLATGHRFLDSLYSDEQSHELDERDSPHV